METKAKPAPYKEVDIYATSQAGEALGGIGDILRPHQEAVNMFLADLH